MNVLEIGTYAFVNRGFDIVQRGCISAHVVSTKEVEGKITTEVSVKYEVKFPCPSPNQFNDGAEGSPFERASYFDSKNVYNSLQEAFLERHNATIE